MPTITWSVSDSQEWTIRTSSGFSSDCIYVCFNGNQIAKLKVTMSRLSGFFAVPVAGVVYHLFYKWDSLGISADSFILWHGLCPIGGWQRGHDAEVYGVPCAMFTSSAYLSAANGSLMYVLPQASHSRHQSQLQHVDLQSL